MIANRKQLVASIVSEFNVKPALAGEITDHILIQLLESGLSGDGFTSPVLRVVARDVPSQSADASGPSSSGAQRKVIRMVPTKKYTEAAQ